MFTNVIKKVTTRISRTGRVNNKSSNRLLLSSKDKHKTSNSLRPANNSRGSRNPVIRKADNKWIGQLKTVAREHKIIIDRNNNEVVVVAITGRAVEADQAEAEEVVVAGEGKCMNYQDFQTALT